MRRGSNLTVGLLRKPDFAAIRPLPLRSSNIQTSPVVIVRSFFGKRGLACKPNMWRPGKFASSIEIFRAQPKDPDSMRQARLDARAIRTNTGRCMTGSTAADLTSPTFSVMLSPLDSIYPLSPNVLRRVGTPTRSSKIRKREHLLDFAERRGLY